MQVRSGLRTRPLRDPLRARGRLRTIGQAILSLAGLWQDTMLVSIRQGDLCHPFLLDLISTQATQTGSTPPRWPTASCWGWKSQHGNHGGLQEELRGQPWEEESPPPPPLGWENYPSAEKFQESIKATFLEEVPMGMVEGPVTQEQAAALCGCELHELCPGPLAGIEESDKIRTIYDASRNGANAHIQQNTKEKTTAPTVMDCLHAVHWLRAAPACLRPRWGGVDLATSRH